MKRLSAIEQIAMMYTFYFCITLYFAPSLFEKEQSNLYKSLLTVIPSQIGWSTLGFLITVLYVVSIFWKNYKLAMITNGVAGIFFTLVSVTYLFTYPNIGLAIFGLVGLKCYQQIYKISNHQEKEKTEKLKLKLESQCKINEYDKGKF